MPDCKVPPSDLRCEAITKPVDTFQDWRRNSHRCVRAAKQSRDGKSVCNQHAVIKKLKYCDPNEPDNFRHKPFWKWYGDLAAIGRAVAMRNDNAKD